MYHRYHREAWYQLSLRILAASNNVKGYKTSEEIDQKLIQYMMEPTTEMKEDLKGKIITRNVMNL